VLGPQVPGTGPALDDAGLLVAGLQSGASAATADLVIVPQGDGSLKLYFYSTATGDTGWKESDGTPAPTAALPADGAFLVKLQSSSDGFEWQPPPSP
jgi:hypothetical protein